MTIYINNFALTNFNVSKRSSTDNWTIVQHPSDTIPFAEQAGQVPTNYTLTMNIHSTTRYAEITNLKNAIKDCEAVYLSSDTVYLFGNKQGVWLAQTQLDIDEAAGPNIPMTLTGVVDPYAFCSCDYSMYWSTTGTATTTSASIHHNGKCSTGAILPKGGALSSITYSPGVGIDFSKASYFTFWVYTDSTIVTPGITLLSSAGNYYFWTTSTWVPFTWTFVKCNLSTPTMTLGTPDPTWIDTFICSLTTPTGSGTCAILFDNMRLQ